MMRRSARRFGSALALAVAAAVLSQGAAAALLSVGAETIVTPEVRETQWRPRAAFDGEKTYLLVWSQGNGLWGGEADIYGARVGSSGAVLDTRPIRISAARDFQKQPAVTWTGDHWLVAWHDLRGGKDYDIYAARVTSEGALLDGEGFPIATGDGDQVMPAVAANGVSSLVVWSDYRAGRYEIYGAVVTGDASGGEAKLLSVEGDLVNPAAAWSGDAYLVTGASTTFRAKGLAVQRIRDGKAAGAPQILSSAPQFDTALAAGAGRALAVVRLNMGKSYEPTHAFGMYLTADGAGAVAANPSREPFSDVRVTSSESAIRLSPRYMVARLWDIDVAFGGDWFLALHSRLEPLVTSRTRLTGREVRQTLFHTLIRAADGQVVDEGRSVDPPTFAAQAPSVCAGPPNSFLVVYERNAGPGDHRIAFRILSVGSLREQ